MTRVDLQLLTRELAAAGIAVPNGLAADEGTVETTHTFDSAMEPAALPPAADPVLAAHKAPPLLVEYAGDTAVHAIVRTTDATPVEVLRFPCELKRLYQASLTISGVDAGSFASKIMEGRFTWKRNTAGAIMVGITVVSDIHDAAAASWAPNAGASGNDIVFTVVGAAGRTIDWLLVGQVGAYAPGGPGS